MIAPDSNRTLTIACLVLSAGGLGAVTGLVSGFLSLGVGLGVFLAALIAATVLLLSERTALCLMLCYSLLLGPFAGLVLWCLLRKGTADTEDTTPKTADVADTPAQRILAQIAQNRRTRYSDAAPLPLAEVFGRSDFKAQQAGLLALARNYGPDLRPALDLALRSPIPAVRVQAAAVFAHLRDSYGERARTLRETPEEFDPQDRRIEAQTLSDSGFVDPVLAARLLTEAGIAPAPTEAAKPPQQDRAAA